MNAELVSLLTNSRIWEGFILILVLVYGSFFGVAYALESRRVTRHVIYVVDGRSVRVREVPVWRGQSRAFLPGDAGLAYLLATCLPFRWALEMPWWAELGLGVASVCIGLFAFKLARKTLYTQEDYKDSWNSPTKILHDFVMYVPFCALLVYACLPVWIASFGSRDEWRTPALAGFLVALVVWGGGMVIDFTPRGKRQIIKQAQHPAKGAYQAAWPWLRRLAAK